MREVTVFTLNAYLCRWFGISLASNIDRRVALIAEHLARLRPDIVCLQEIWDSRIVPALLAGLPDHQVVFGPGPDWRHPLGCGLVVATRLPIGGSSFCPVSSTRRLKEVLAQRGLLICEVACPAGEARDSGAHHGMSAGLTIINTHLGVGWRAAQQRQHGQVLDALTTLGSTAAVLCGDLNTPAVDIRPEGLIVSELSQRGWKDTLKEVHGPAATIMLSIDDRNPLVRRGYRRRIDYIWVKPGPEGVRVLDAGILLNTPQEGVYPSDHFAGFARMGL